MEGTPQGRVGEAAHRCCDFRTREGTVIFGDARAEVVLKSTHAAPCCCCQHGWYALCIRVLGILAVDVKQRREMVPRRITRIRRIQYSHLDKRVNDESGIMIATVLSVVDAAIMTYDSASHQGTLIVDQGFLSSRVRRAHPFSHGDTVT